VNHFQGGKSSRARGNNMIQEAAVDSPLSQLPSQTMEGESSLSGQASEYEEAESGRKFCFPVLCNGK
jgi:calmodulin-binding transcription activator